MTPKLAISSSLSFTCWDIGRKEHKKRSEILSENPSDCHLCGPSECTDAMDKVTEVGRANEITESEVREHPKISVEPGLHTHFRWCFRAESSKRRLAQTQTNADFRLYERGPKMQINSHKREQTQTNVKKSKSRNYTPLLHTPFCGIRIALVCRKIECGVFGKGGSALAIVESSSNPTSQLQVKYEILVTIHPQ